jgi:hypothetical protein
MRLPLLTSFLILISFTVNAQELGTEDNSDKKILLGIDGIGTVLSPIIGTALLGEVVFRPSVLIGFQVHDKLMLEANVEYNNIEGKDMQNNFKNYRMSGFAIKPSIAYHKKGRAFLAGFGVIYSQQRESGVISIPGQTFSNYEQFRSHNVTSSGIFGKMGFIIPLHPKVDFRIEGNIFIMETLSDHGPESPGDFQQKIQYVAGANKSNSFNQSNAHINIRTFGYICYRF